MTPRGLCRFRLGVWRSRSTPARAGGNNGSLLQAWLRNTPAQRVRLLSPAARAVHGEILAAFAATGRAPHDPALLARRRGAEPTAVFAELSEHDLIQPAADGTIRAAYPYSRFPTAHRAAIQGGGSPYAMCAIDALGISAMLGDRPVTVTSHEPGTGQVLTVAVTGHHAEWHPDSAVVLLGVPGGGGPAALRVCSAINFFTSAAAAHTWAASHPDAPGPVLCRTQAVELAVASFAALLHGGTAA